VIVRTTLRRPGFTLVELLVVIAVYRQAQDA
jgi:Tfp pilus assembly protein FimT